MLILTARFKSGSRKTYIFHSFKSEFVPEVNEFNIQGTNLEDENKLICLNHIVAFETATHFGDEGSCYIGDEER